MNSASAKRRLRPTWVEISRAALLHNVGCVRSAMGADVGILTMIKADAYGHGAARVGEWLASSGEVQALGVATIEEGVELRDAGIDAPICVMGGLMGQGGRAAEVAVASNLTCVVHSVETLVPLATAAKAAGRMVPFHLKIDTGMTRMGARPEIVAQLLDAIPTDVLRLEGVMTHLAHVVDRDYTRQQVAQFVEVATVIRQRVEGPMIWHIGNSAAIMDHSQQVEAWCLPFPLAAGDTFWVRPGIMLYGIAPFPEYLGQMPLQPVMSIKSEVVLVKHVPEGTKVSYGGTWQATRPTRLGLLPIGYADGFGWSLSNRGEVLLPAGRAPVVGRVTMDMIMCDLTDLPDVHVGAEAVLLGQAGDAAITAESLSELCGTIPYEVVCRISKRMPRQAV